MCGLSSAAAKEGQQRTGPVHQASIFPSWCVGVDPDKCASEAQMIAGAFKQRGCGTAGIVADDSAG